MKNSLILMGMLIISTSVIAGGDDRDRGPVEPLDTVAPTIKKSTNIQEPKKMKLMIDSRAISTRAHAACQATIGLSESNISNFRNAISGGYLYNVGPIESSLGTVFSPKRWDAYFDCVNKYDG